MKHKTKQKLFFVAGAVFGLALLGVSVGIIAAQTTWSPPPGQFPAANVYAPLDTSDTPQAKKGSLTIGSATSGVVINPPSATNLNAIKIETNNYLQSGDNILFINVGGNFKFYSPNGGIILPKLPTDPAMTDTGAIYYNTASNSVKLNKGSANGGWVDIGAWTLASDGVLTYSGDVRILGKTQGKFKYVNEIPVLNPVTDGEEGKQLGCDGSLFYKECPHSYGEEFYNGGFMDGSTPTSGDIGVDNFVKCPTSFPSFDGEKCFNDSGKSTNPIPYVDRYKYEITPATDATLNVGSISVNNINVNENIHAENALLSAGNISTEGILVGGIADIAKLKVGGLQYSKSVTMTNLSGRDKSYDTGVKGILVSFTVNVGGSDGQATTFSIVDSVNSSDHEFTYFAWDEDVSVGIDTIKINIPHPSHYNYGQKQHIDSITINYIPIE